MTDVDALISSHQGIKGNLSRKLHVAERIISQAQNLGPSTVLQAQMEEIMDQLERAFSKVETSLRRIQHESPADQFQAYEDKLEGEFVRTNKIVKIITQLRVQFEHDLKPKAAPAPAPAAAPRAVKPNEALKPKTLTRDSNPVELTVWEKKLTSYFLSGNLDKVSLLEQQAHFHSCLDNYLSNRLEDKIKPGTPVLPDPASVDVSCVELLRTEFLVQHPLFSRRLDFFKYTQAQGQAFTDWAQKLRKKGDEADLAALTVDDLYSMRYFTGVTDQELRKEFLKQTDKASKNLLEVADTYEMGRRYDKSMRSSTTAAANNVTSGKKKPAKGQATGSKPTVSPVMRDLQREGKCFGCGQKPADRAAHKDQCKARDATCKNCGRKGHFKTVCFKGSQPSGSTKYRNCLLYTSPSPRDS